MKTRSIALVVMLALIAIGASLFAYQSADAKGPKPKPIDFTLTNTDDKKVKLADYRGKVVVIDVWATWCGYCVRETPDLIAVQEEATKNKQKLQLIGISVDEDKEAVKEFVEKHGVNYPILYAEKDAMKQLGEVYGYPTKFILNEKGVIVDTIVGAVDKATLKKRLAKYLK